MIPIVLASASPRRKALLEALGIAVEVVPSHVDELSDGPPEALALSNARHKRDDIASRLTSPAIVIAADTVVISAGRVMGKPHDFDEARAMLRAHSGATHTVVTAVAVMHSETRRKAEGAERTEVRFRPLSDAEIDVFVDAVKPTDRAGAYTSDGPGSLLIEGYVGCYYNVLGLPLVRLDLLLRSIGDGLFQRIDADRAIFL